MDRETIERINLVREIKQMLYSSDTVDVVEDDTGGTGDLRVKKGGNWYHLLIVTTHDSLETALVSEDIRSLLRQKYRMTSGREPLIKLDTGSIYGIYLFPEKD